MLLWHRCCIVKWWKSSKLWFDFDLSYNTTSFSFIFCKRDSNLESLFLDNFKILKVWDKATWPVTFPSNSKTSRLHGRTTSIWDCSGSGCWRYENIFWWNFMVSFFVILFASFSINNKQIVYYRSLLSNYFGSDSVSKSKIFI